MSFYGATDPNSDLKQNAEKLTEAIKAYYKSPIAPVLFLAGIGSGYLAYKRNNDSALRAFGGWLFSVPYLAWVGFDRIVGGNPLLPTKANPSHKRKRRRSRRNL